MKTRSFFAAGCVALLHARSIAQAQTAAPPDLAGLWEAKARSGPDIGGPVMILRNSAGWTADVSGFRVPVRAERNALSFALPGSRGSFRGSLTGGQVEGHWFTRWYATPLVLKPAGEKQWKGTLTLLPSSNTYFMPIKRNTDGTYDAYLRHPESNQGRWYPKLRLEMSGDVIRLIGRRGNQPERTIAEGRYDDGVIRIPINGTSFDFEKSTDSSSAFYPRNNPPARYRYTAPIRVDDGWPVASVEDVGISRDRIEQFVQQLIDMPMDSAIKPQIHSLLIARHGKLVVEEYFHGYDRDTPHDTRSAAKSWGSVLLGAAMLKGVPLNLKTPVYQTMLGSVPANLDPRKRAMTLEHLISMTAGFDCGNGEESPGDEDVMQNQTKEQNWYTYSLNVPMVTTPGDTIVYCSIEPNLALGMLQKIAREPLQEMFYRLVAKPMQLSNYHLFLTPMADVYGGGGHRFTSRDMMKLAQLMLNEGKWWDKQIVSRDWALKSGAALRTIWQNQQYGWLWNSIEYPWNGKKVRAVFAAGNGGQLFYAFPDLDLVIGFTAGNYNDRAAGAPAQIYVPQYLLPAVMP